MARSGRTSWWPQQAAGPVIIQDAAGNYLRLPKLTTTQRNALTAVNGMIIYNSSTTQVEVYDNGSWRAAGQLYGDATFLPLGGGTMTGAINLGNYVPTNVAGLARSLFKGEVKAIPLVPSTLWVDTAVNGGSVADNTPFLRKYRATAAVGPNSSIVSYAAAFGMNSNGAAVDRVDWDKNLLICCTALRLTSVANAVSFIQLKENTAIGELGELGIEFRIANLALNGNAYGASLGTEVDLSQSLTSNQPALLSMFLNSSGVEWFFNNVSKGTLTAANKFPTGMGAATAAVVISHTNGGTATQSDLIIGNIWVIQGV